MPHQSPQDLGPVRARIDEMLADGREFEHIEMWIESQELPEDTKSALWLWLWSATAPQRFRPGQLSV